MEQPPNSGNYVLQNVHGAGAQRSDPKSGDPDDWPHGNGPQGDLVRIYNCARCVRDADPYLIYLPLIGGGAQAWLSDFARNPITIPQQSHIQIQYNPQQIFTG